MSQLMNCESDRFSKFVEEKVISLLGQERVRKVSTATMENADGQKIARVTIVYSATDGLGVEDMDRVLDALWPSDEPDNAPFPIIDFQEDTDVGPIAAE